MIRGPMPQSTHVPLVMIALVCIDCGELIMEAPAEQHPLNDGIRVVAYHSVNLPQILSYADGFLCRRRAVCAELRAGTRSINTRRAVVVACKQRMNAAFPRCIRDVSRVLIRPVNALLTTLSQRA